MRGKVKIMALGSVVILVLCICVYIARLIYWANNTEIEMEGKTCITLHVDEEVVDYATFIAPSDKVYALRFIDDDIRFQIAKYMKIKKLKLKEGTYSIPPKGVVDGGTEEFTYNDYMQIFQFEKMEE